ncbi:LAFE_0E11804g1_1 [Lachancea fermentati]|uniref:LAFE_0E11804g1_1 n=1 Tax=Lachancea fermentati TaxID=4955 RepID=A0A1G4MDJ2_LACFM|nr:LAFE_0E11804g1_1 [Lachancea fermentati]
MKRGLPSLTTGSDGSSTLASSGADSSATQASNSGSSGSASSTSTSGTSTGTGSSSTLSYSVPTITPPSTEGNPNIWSAGQPSGTIFIAVGAIVGTAFLALLIWYFATAYISRRQTQKLRLESIDQQFRSHISDTFPDASNGFDSSAKEIYDLEKDAPYKGSNPSWHKKSNSHSMIRLLGSDNADDYPQRRTSQDSGSSIPQEMFSSIQDSNQAQNRRSLFISPTVEISNQHRRSRLLQNMNNSVSSLVSGLEPNPELNKPERAASPERKKKSFNRNQSSQGGTAPSLSPTRRMKADRKETPSMYLEHMLEDNN